MTCTIRDNLADGVLVAAINVTTRVRGVNNDRIIDTNFVGVRVESGFSQSMRDFGKILTEENSPLTQAHRAGIRCGEHFGSRRCPILKKWRVDKGDRRIGVKDC